MRLVGRREPRLYTPPLRKLTPRTSKGFEVVDFAEKVLGLQLMPWQKWLLVHGLELLPDGQYRWREVIVLVARQNGKTTLLAVLALWRILIDNARLVLGTSTNLDYARESWEFAVELAENSAEAAPEFRWPPRRANGEQTFTAVTGARYKIAAANRRGGRSLAVDLAIADELREHQDWQAWAALSGTTTARPDPQLWALSNAGDDTSVVLNHYRDAAVAAIETGEPTGDTALFEWSAPDDCDLTDRRAWAMANPALSHTITERTLIGKLKLPAPVFRTEHLCRRVATLDAAIDIGAWVDCKDTLLTLDTVRDRVAACVDVAPDGAHVSLVVAGQHENRILIEPVAAWTTTDQARDELPAQLEQLNPYTVAWYPSGPAAAIGPLMRKLNAHAITGGDVGEACQSFADLVTGRRIIHAGDPLLDTQLAGASKLHTGDGWRFTRRGGGHCDSVYAAAGATHIALTVPVPQRTRPLIIVRDQPPAA